MCLVESEIVILSRGDFAQFWGLPCEPNDLSLEVRQWEFGSSPTQLEGSAGGDLKR